MPAQDSGYDGTNYLGIARVIGSAPQDFLAQASALNPLRTTTGPRNTSTRGRPAVQVTVSDAVSIQRTDLKGYLDELRADGQYQRYLDSSATPDKNSLSPKLKTQLPSLNDVPPLYLQPDFDLALPRIFDAVTKSPASVPVEDALPSPDLATDQLLQERLSHYLDIVEQHLATEIAHRSASFFSALSNLQALDAQSKQALERAADLKTELAQVDKRTARKGLAVTRANLRRRRMQDIAQTIDRLKDIWRAIDQAEQLVMHSEWEAALGIVDELSAAYSQDAPVRLNKLHSLDQVPDKLAALRQQIGQALQVELSGVLMHELEEQLAKELDFEAFKVKEQAADRARPLIRGLVRCGCTSVAATFNDWRSTTSGAIKRVVTTSALSGAGVNLTEDGDLMAPNFSATQAARFQHLRDLEPPFFLNLMTTTYHRSYKALQIIQVHSEVLINLIEDAENSFSVQERNSSNDLKSDLQDMLFAAAEVAHQRSAKLLGIRVDQTTKLALKEFVLLFDATWDFVLKSEVLCKRMIVGLRGAIVSQAKTYLQTFHQANVSASAKLVEEEQWTVVDILPSAQHVIALIIDGAMADSVELVLRGNTVTPTATEGRNTEKQVDIEGRRYFAVAACLSCTESLLEYLKIIVNVPLLTTDSMSKIIEFLKQFNSRTCQMVLGAGAMRSAGLKNITAKHLALASQCLSIIINLIPYVREFLRRHLNPKQAVMLVEFDKLKRDYQEHQNEIYSKLVAIMGDRLNVHCKALQAVDWSQDSAGAASPYMEALAKEATTLHRVLSRYMPGEPLELVMMQVMSSIASRLAEEYSKLELADESAKARLLKDARYLKGRLAELKGLERAAPGSDLEELVKTMPTKEPIASRLDLTLNSGRHEEVSPAETTTVVLVGEPLKEKEDTASVQKLQATSNVKNRLGALFNKASLRRGPPEGALPPQPPVDKLDAENEVVDATSSSEPSQEPYAEPSTEPSLIASEPDTPAAASLINAEQETEPDNKKPASDAAQLELPNSPNAASSYENSSLVAPAQTSDAAVNEAVPPVDQVPLGEPDARNSISIFSFTPEGIHSLTDVSSNSLESSNKIDMPKDEQDQGGEEINSATVLAEDL